MQHREPGGDRGVVVAVVGLQPGLTHLAPPRLLVPLGDDPAPDVHVGVEPQRRVEVLAHVRLGQVGPHGGDGGAQGERGHAPEEPAPGTDTPARCRYVPVTARFAAWRANR